MTKLTTHVASLIKGLFCHKLTITASSHEGSQVRTEAAAPAPLPSGAWPHMMHGWGGSGLVGA